MIRRACLAISLLAALSPASLAAEPPAALAVDSPPPPSDVPEPPVAAPPGFRVPPRPVYPVEALRNDIGGRCMVSFTVNAEGVPQNIVPDCDHPVFTAPARDAVAAARLDMGAEVQAGDVFRLPLRFQPADWDSPQD